MDPDKPPIILGVSGWFGRDFQSHHPLTPATAWLFLVSTGSIGRKVITARSCAQSDIHSSFLSVQPTGPVQNQNHALKTGRSKPTFSTHRPMKHMKQLAPLLSIFFTLQGALVLPGPIPARGESNLVSSPNFESGEMRFAHWQLTGCRGHIESATNKPQPVIVVTGNGNDSGYWKSDEIPLQPGGLYELTFLGRWELVTRSGTALAGTSRVNRDFSLDREWGRHGFVFMTPHDVELDYFRFGQWQTKGDIFFADPLLRPVIPVHIEVEPGFELGEGEWVSGRQYCFVANYDWRGANYHRPLVCNRAGFNSNRWLFSPGAEVVYRHRVGNFRQVRAKLNVAINYHVGGMLLVEASKDATNWTTLAKYDGKVKGGLLELPPALFPSHDIFIRLSQQGDGAGFQVDTYSYEATLDGETVDAHGTTLFVSVVQSTKDVGVNLLPRKLASPYTLYVCLTNLSTKTVSITKTICQTKGSRVIKSINRKLSPGSKYVVSFDLASTGGTEAVFDIAVCDSNSRTLWAAECALRFGILDDAAYGYWLKNKKGLVVWWCESGWKVGRTRPAPPRSHKPRPITVCAARGEYEPVQVVLRPETDLGLKAVCFGQWQCPRKAHCTPVLEINEVAYVHITRPTDGTCAAGWYPDPLPPLNVPMKLKGGVNQPFWITIWVPPEAIPGDYKCTVKFTTSLGSLDVPFLVHVYDFKLPSETHLRSAFGLNASAINLYHKLVDPQDKIAVYEKYLENFARHRISPYSFYHYAPIDVRFEVSSTNRRAIIDFSKFDAAAQRWLDTARFNSFLLPLQGMGGGTFHSRHLGSIAGFQEGTPEHTQLFQDYLGQIEKHLGERGWLDKAYVYWFDEPEPKDYEFVTAGMKRIHDAAPRIKRLLTEQPEPELIGNVDIWCALTPEWTHERVRERKEAGEEVWWYICTGPKAPYVTEFIDHPGTELRLWPWQSWQYGVDGILVWETTYWNSSTAYPPPNLQNPWEDPMSWVSGYGTATGTRLPWGNGDGRFLYPPRRNPNEEGGPLLTGPIDSIRWENLRDGIEDYEYLWTLKQLLKRVHEKGQSAPQAEQLLIVPDHLSQDLTHFTVDPRKIIEHRAHIAAMIEKLKKEYNAD